MTTYAAVQAAISSAQPISCVGGTNLLPGEKSPKAIPCVCDFSATGIPATGYIIDPTQFFQSKYLLAIQTLYIDNSANNGYVTVSNPQFNQSFSLPAGYQGYFAILGSNQSNSPFYVTSSGNQIARVLLLNTYFASQNWPATITPFATGTPVPVSDAILDATVYGGRVQTYDLIAGTTASDGSGTIAAGGTAQTLFAANPARQGILIQNIDETILEQIGVNFTGTAAIGSAGTFILGAGATGSPGGSLQLGAVTGAVSIIAATTGHKFTAIQF